MIGLLLLVAVAQAAPRLIYDATDLMQVRDMEAVDTAISGCPELVAAMKLLGQDVDLTVLHGAENMTHPIKITNEVMFIDDVRVNQLLLVNPIGYRCSAPGTPVVGVVRIHVDADGKLDYVCNSQHHTRRRLAELIAPHAKVVEILYRTKQELMDVNAELQKLREANSTRQEEISIIRILCACLFLAFAGIVVSMPAVRSHME